MSSFTPSRYVPGNRWIQDNIQKRALLGEPFSFNMLLDWLTHEALNNRAYCATIASFCLFQGVFLPQCGGGDTPILFAWERG